jgi:aminotransferase EvaB
MKITHIPTPNSNMLLINDLKRKSSQQLQLVRAAVDRVISSGWYSMGPELEKFEEAFSNYIGSDFSMGVASGTDALEIALRALGCGPNDEVITVANAGGYASTAITNIGSKPIYVDIQSDSLNMSPDSLKLALNTKTKAIIVTHLFGRMADIEKIMAHANKAAVPVIEDCAQAHGAMKNDRRAGAWGIMGCFSFYPTKNLGAFGDGGAITTSDPTLAKRINSIRQYGWERKYIISDTVGINSRLDEIQAAILFELLPYLDESNQKRRVIINKYRKELASIKGLALPPPGTVPNQEDYVAHLCVIRSPNRDEYREYLGSHKISTDIHYPVPDYCQTPFIPNTKVADVLEETELATTEVFTVPCFPEMTKQECEYVINIIQKYESEK